MVLDETAFGALITYSERHARVWHYGTIFRVVQVRSDSHFDLEVIEPKKNPDAHADLLVVGRVFERVMFDPDSWIQLSRDDDPNGRL